MGKERFTDVEIPKMHALHAVAEHEVLMSFHGDSDAVRFREWWDDEGAILFNDWLKENAAK